MHLKISSEVYAAPCKFPFVFRHRIKIVLKSLSSLLSFSCDGMQPFQICSCCFQYFPVFFFSFYVVGGGSVVGGWVAENFAIASSLSSNPERHFVLGECQGKQKALRTDNNGCHWHQGWHQNLFCVFCRMPPLLRFCICCIPNR